MIGVTIGLGATWISVAKRAAARMSEFTGLDCKMIDSWHGPEYEHPAWLKCRILDIFRGENDFFYFDSDIWCVKPWKPEKIFEGCNRDFVAVPAVDNKFIEQECKRFNLPLGGQYISAGLLMFGREHRGVFEYAESLHPAYGSWFDQTPINVALTKSVAVTRLPQKYAAETHGGNFVTEFNGVNQSDVINYHFCSCGGDADRIRQLQESFYE